jgi:hypothetical protein
MTRHARAARFTPLLGIFAACLLVHWQGFQSWFRADDLAWLQLAGHVHDFGSFLSAMFQPLAEGTVRPWSERAFFMAGYGLFGLDPLPFRILVYATQFANLALAASIGARLTGSRLAGYTAALLWVIHSASVEPLSWTSAYNQVLCAFFLLVATRYLIRFAEKGRRRDEAVQWGAFVLGFGAHESMIVYPAIAAIYAVLFSPRLLRRIAPMFAVSAAYVVLHASAATPPRTGVYALHFTGAMFRTLARYWSWTAGPSYGWTPVNAPTWLVGAAVVVLTVGLAAFAARSVAAGQRAAIFCLAWYGITILPFLPLRDHRMDYYLFVPVTGICWLGGWAIVYCWRRGGALRAAAGAFVALYILLMLPRTLAASAWNHHVSMRVRDVMRGLSRVHELHSGKTVALDGVDDDLFWNLIVENPGPLAGIDKVYLTPGTERKIAPTAEEETPSAFVLPPNSVRNALLEQRLVVYDVRTTPMRNITSDYAAKAATAGLPRKVNAAAPLDAYLLGPEWYPADGNHRWMPARATLRIGGPDGASQRLWLSGTRADTNPSMVTVTVNGDKLPPAGLPPQPGFELSFSLPFAAKSLDVTIEVSRTVRVPGDSRDLGLSFGVIEVR